MVFSKKAYHFLLDKKKNHIIISMPYKEEFKNNPNIKENN